MKQARAKDSIQTAVVSVRKALETLELLKTHLHAQPESSVDRYITPLERAIELTGQLEELLRVHRGHSE